MGYLVKRGEDRWACVVYLDRQRSVEGKTKERRLWRTVRGSKQDAKRLLLTLEQQHERRELDLRRETVGEYLTRWLDQVAPRSAGATTIESYRMIVKKHLVPSLGSVRLDRLTSRKIDAYLGEMLTKGRSPKHPSFKRSPGLSAETVRRHYRVLHKALQDAVAEGVLAANPAAKPRVKVPKRQRREMRTLNEVQVLRFLEAAKASRLSALFEMAVYTGARQAELLGARWADLNLEMGALSIQQIYYRGVFKAPKTEHSRRSVELDAYLVEILRRHQQAQRRERELFGKDYQDADLVFCQPDGRPLDGQSLTRNEYRRLLEKAKCPPVRFHDLRHTCATLRFQQGEHPKSVSDLLGHSGIGITMDLYSHAIPGLQRQATSRFTQHLQALKAAQVPSATDSAPQGPAAEPLSAPDQAAEPRLQAPIH